MLNINKLLLLIYNKKNYSKLYLLLFSINTLNVLFTYITLIILNLFKILGNDIKNIFYLFFYFNDIILLINFNCNNFSKLINSNNIFINIKLKKNFNIINYFINVFSLILSITNLFINIYYNNILINSNYNLILNYYILFFTTFYSINIKLSILNYFMLYIININQVFKNFIMLNQESNLKLFELISQYIEIRHNYNRIIGSFNKIIPYNIIINYFPILFLFNNFNNYEYYDPLYYFFTIYYIIFLLIIQYYLNILDDNIKKLKYINDKSIYIKNYLIRKNELYKINDLENTDQKELNIKNFIIDIENSESIDWNIFSNVLQQNLNKFDIFGIEISNNNFLNRLIGLTFTIILIPIIYNN